MRTFSSVVYFLAALIAALSYDLSLVSELQSSNVDCRNLESRGFSAVELKSGGFDASALLLAGFSGPELQSIGFDIASLDTTSLISAASSLNVSLAMTDFSKEQLEEAGLPTDKCIIFKGYIYKTLGDHDPSSVHVIDECGKFYDLESGWQISPATPDALHVCAAYPWATRTLVLEEGNAYYTALAPKINASPGAKAKSGCLTRNEKRGHAIVGFDSLPSFCDVLLTRKLRASLKF